MIRRVRTSVSATATEGSPTEGAVLLGAAQDRDGDRFDELDVSLGAPCCGSIPRVNMVGNRNYWDYTRSS